MPTSWADLTDPVYKNQIVMSNPASSGTGYLSVSAILQMMGEEQGWEYLDALHQNVAQYMHSGSKPCKVAGTGDRQENLPNVIPVTIEDLEFLGSSYLVTLAVDGDEEISLTVSLPIQAACRIDVSPNPTFLTPKAIGKAKKPPHQGLNLMCAPAVKRHALFSR